MEENVVRVTWNPTLKAVEVHWLSAPERRDLRGAISTVEDMVRVRRAPMVIEHRAGLHEALGRFEGWFEDQWVPRLVKSGTKRLAIVLQRSEFAGQSLERVVVRDATTGFVQHAFADEDSAGRWLERQGDLLSAGVAERPAELGRGEVAYR